MLIKSFWVKGYRSLRDVRLDGLGAFNVFYGPNGAGKSNLLSALHTLFGLAGLRAKSTPLDRPQEVAYEPWIDNDDLCKFEDSRRVVLGVSLDAGSSDSSVLPNSNLSFPSLILEVTLDWVDRTAPQLWFSRLEGNADLLPVFRADTSVEDESLIILHENLGPAPGDWSGTEEECREEFREWVVRPIQRFLMELPGRAYALIQGTRGAVGSSAREGESGGEQGASDHARVISSRLQDGQVARALVEAQQSPVATIRSGFENLRNVLQGPPLNRAPFDPVRDGLRGKYELRERTGDVGDVPVDLAGLGMVQIYTILAHILLRGAGAVGVEEPEAHLHSPTTGHHLRELLKRVVDEGHVQQLFIATHSNLFDLDPGGYFDVRMNGEEGTVIERIDDLSRIDRDHLYEPGPAKHALMRSMSYLEPEDVVFRRPDGTPVSCQEMLEMLERDDPVAMGFLKDVHGAAIRAVRVRAKDEPEDQ